MERIVSSLLLICFTLSCTAVLACRSATISPEGYLVGSGGVRIFYRVVGNGPDTIVTIHGGPGGDMDNIAPDLERLGSRHVVIYYDQRGGGRSEHSFGPVLAARYAQVYPDHVGRMIFVGAIGPRHTDAQSYGRTMYARMQPATRDSVIALVQALISGMNPDPVATCRAYEELVRHAALMQGDSSAPKGGSCRAPPEAVEYAHRYTSQVTFASLGKWDYNGALRRVSAPLLVIYGDRDPSPVSSQWAWAAAVPDGRLLVIPGAGHGPHVDRPNVFFPAVDAFLSGSWPQGAASARP